MSESAIVREVAEKAARRITRKVIGALQKLTNTLSGDDSELKTVWDEICAQVQLEQSCYWDDYIETVKQIVPVQLEKLAKNEREAMWLQTHNGIDWSCEEPEDRDPNPIWDDDIVEWVIDEYVLSEAANWSNERIRAYLERSSMRD
jgi:hypothetical protein